MAKKQRYIYVGALKGSEAYHYRFTCPECKNKFILAAGAGRFGKLGPFMCPACDEMYYASIDNHRFPKLYIEKSEEREPGSTQMKPIATLEEIDDTP